MNHQLRVTTIVPAHNEERNIAACVGSLVEQTYPLTKIVVVNDASTDRTEEILQGLSMAFPQVVYINKQYDGTMRAGAVNVGLAALDESFELVLVGDADAIFDVHLVEQAVRVYEKDHDGKIGGVCSNVELRPGNGLLHRLQKLEYGGFNADRTMTWNKVMIIHGLCGVYRLGALKEVGGYTPHHLLEDYDLTVRLKKAGYKTVFNPRMVCSAESVPTWRQLLRQRVRWFRGGIDILLQHGINRYTWEDFFYHVVFVLLFLIILTVIAIGIAVSGRWSPQPNWHPIPIAVFILGLLEGFWRLRWVKNRDWKDVLLRLSIVPELLYYMILSGLRLYCYGLALARTKRRW